MGAALQQLVLKIPQSTTRGEGGGNFSVSTAPVALQPTRIKPRGVPQCPWGCCAARGGAQQAKQAWGQMGTEWGQNGDSHPRRALPVPPGRAMHGRGAADVPANRPIDLGVQFCRCGSLWVAWGHEPQHAFSSHKKARRQVAATGHLPRNLPVALRWCSGVLGAGAAWLWAMPATMTTRKDTV